MIFCSMAIYIKRGIPGSEYILRKGPIDQVNGTDRACSSCLDGKCNHGIVDFEVPEVDICRVASPSGCNEDLDLSTFCGTKQKEAAIEV